MRYPFKIGDIFVYIMILLLIGGSFFGLYQMRVRSNYAQAIIELDGTLIGTYEIPTGDTIKEVRVDAGEGRYNIVKITSTGTYIEEANCRDQICVKWGKVSNPGQAIVCLPHKVVVSIIGNQEGEPPLDDIAS